MFLQAKAIETKCSLGKKSTNEELNMNLSSDFDHLTDTMIKNRKNTEENGDFCDDFQCEEIMDFY